MLQCLLRQQLRNNCNAARVAMGMSSHMNGTSSMSRSAVDFKVNVNSGRVLQCRYLGGSSKVIIPNVILFWMRF